MGLPRYARNDSMENCHATLARTVWKIATFPFAMTELKACYVSVRNDDVLLRVLDNIGKIFVCNKE